MIDIDELEKRQTPSGSPAINNRELAAMLAELRAARVVIAQLRQWKSLRFSEKDNWYQDLGRAFEATYSALDLYDAVTKETT